MGASPFLVRLARLVAEPAPPSSDHDPIGMAVGAEAGAAPPRAPPLIPAAVLMALAEGPAGPEVVLTRRAAGLRHHAGQVAFPGGRIDRTDADPEAAALREAAEEIALPPGQVRLIGRLPGHVTVTGYHVTPVVGWIEGRFEPRPDPAEVAEVFAVPFAHLADPARYRIEARLWQGQLRHYPVIPWGPHYIWGATARILRALAYRLGS